MDRPHACCQVFFNFLLYGSSVFLREIVHADIALSASCKKCWTVEFIEVCEGLRALDRYTKWISRNPRAGFPETRAVTQPEPRHYYSGLLRLSQKARLPDGLPESRLSRIPAETRSESTGF